MLCEIVACVVVFSGLRVIVNGVAAHKPLDAALFVSTGLVMVSGGLGSLMYLRTVKN